MKIRSILLFLILTLGAVSSLRSFMQFRGAATKVVSAQRVMAQKPRRWVAGDTLWMEIDSIPTMPSDEELVIESLLVVYPDLDLSIMHTDTLYRYKLPEHITIDYRLPYWSVYRRSVTLWGITFSVGQINPYAPYPAAAAQDATVLSFPLQHPR